MAKLTIVQIHNIYGTASVQISRSPIFDIV